jgi:hypothetical protein
MSLPTAWVDKIFTKLSLIYGRDFIGRWEGIELADVKTDWSHELSGFENWPEAIAWALKNMPAGKPPTVLEFRAMCYRAPKPERPQLPEPTVDPAIVAREFEKMKPMQRPVGGYDHKAWARKLIARHDAGDNIRLYSLKLARAALKSASA